MSDLALLGLALSAAIAGMALLALSIGAHWHQLAGARPHPRGLRIGLRTGGATLLGLAFGLCALADPLSMAALVWPMVLTVAAATVAATLTLHARRSGSTARR